ncbi:MAG: VOC family protein, partial [Acidimicrobiia bacterium]|nr:VOC family protein [Acidimicrobiia bacterium]
DQTHGARTATISDPYGHRWMLNTQLSSPSVEEIDSQSPGFTVTGAAGEGSAVQPIQLGYYTIRTDDIELAAAFYSELLGWNVDPVNGHVSNCDLPFGFENQYYEGVNLWMTVRDPEPMLARVAELGGRIIEDTMSPSGRAIECRDDQGRRFDLHTPAPGYG